MRMWLAKQKAKAELLKAFRNGEIGNRYSYSSNTGLVYPKIHTVQFDRKKKTLIYVFTLPTGMDPKEVIKKDYCFKQVFGERIELKGDVKKFTLTVFTAPSPTLVRYEAERFSEQAKNAKLPIVCGIDMNGQNVVYDMLEHPHLLIAGETGSGKSTQLRSILTSLITMIDPNRLQLFLCDLKRSEFHLFRGVKHVEAVLVSPIEMLPMLIHLREETTKRGDLLDAHEVAHIDDLPDPPPYIV
ncbi:FtsK/SpoIIIE domain-containing protein, partial [Peribacillus muralis]|uniref:FtsK/SpoIIIE domain-containing protein n=2 Tax=Bacteria TaxID=2 RepID=UPI003D26DE67